MCVLSKVVTCTHGGGRACWCAAVSVPAEGAGSENTSARERQAGKLAWSDPRLLGHAYKYRKEKGKDAEIL